MRFDSVEKSEVDVLVRFQSFAPKRIDVYPLKLINMEPLARSVKEKLFVSIHPLIEATQSLGTARCMAKEIDLSYGLYMGESHSGNCNGL